MLESFERTIARINEISKKVYKYTYPSVNRDKKLASKKEVKKSFDSMLNIPSSISQAKIVNSITDEIINALNLKDNSKDTIKAILSRYLPTLSKVDDLKSTLSKLNIHRGGLL